MRITVLRKSTFFTHRYTVSEHPNLSGSARWFGSSFYQHIKVCSAGNELYCLKETNLLRFCLNIIPIFWGGRVRRFDLFKHGHYWGHSKKLNGCGYLFSAGENHYELRIHSHGIGSLLKDGEQCARLQVCFKNDSYTINYRNFSDDTPEVLLLFCIFMDAYYFANRGTMSQNTFVISDQYSDRAHWNP